MMGDGGLMGNIFGTNKNAAAPRVAAVRLG